MVADKRSIEIVLKLEDASASDDTNVSSKTNTNSKSNDEDKRSKSVAWALATQEAEIILGEVVAWADYYWNRELTLNDDYIGQREKNIAMTQINRAISVGSNILSSAATGAAVGGPVGALIGTVIGTANQAAGIIRSNIQGNDQQNIALRQMDAQLQFTRARAGWSTSAASIGDNL